MRERNMNEEKKRTKFQNIQPLPYEYPSNEDALIPNLTTTLTVNTMKTKETCIWQNIQPHSSILIRSMNDTRWANASMIERFNIYLERLCDAFESNILPTDPAEKNIKQLALDEAKEVAKKAFSHQSLENMTKQLKWFHENFWQYLDCADEELRPDPPSFLWSYEDTAPLCSFM